MPQRILKTILIIMLVALLFINVNTVINVNYVRAEEPTTQVITSDNTENESSTELLSQLFKKLYQKYLTILIIC